MMTFFMGCFDTSNGKFTYSNASHDPPIWLQKKEDKLKRKDIEVLMGEPGNRLGQQEDSKYKPMEIQLAEGDRIIFYTDDEGTLDIFTGYIREVIKSESRCILWVYTSFVYNSCT